MTLLGETIMGGAEYYQKSPYFFSDLYFLQYYLLHVFNYKIKIKLHKMKE